MTVVQLASASDVAAEMGRSLTSEEATRVEPILDKVSELFRAEARRTFTTGESTTRLRVAGREVILKERPVVEVTDVVDDDSNDVPYQWIAPGTLLLDRRLPFVTVTYSHGGAVPDLVRLTVASIARQVLSYDQHAQAGATAAMETTGPFTTQRAYAVWAQGGAARLSPEDKKIARRYRIKRRAPIPQKRTPLPTERILY